MWELLQYVCLWFIIILFLQAFFVYHPTVFGCIYLHVSYFCFEFFSVSLNLPPHASPTRALSLFLIRLLPVQILTADVAVRVIGIPYTWLVYLNIEIPQDPNLHMYYWIARKGKQIHNFERLKANSTRAVVVKASLWPNRLLCLSRPHSRKLPSLAPGSDIVSSGRLGIFNGIQKCFRKV